MRNIAEFLERFKKLKRPGADKEEIAGIINKTTNLKLTSEEIVLQGRGVFVKVGGMEKTEILLKREQILKNLKEEITGLKIEDLR